MGGVATLTLVIEKPRPIPEAPLPTPVASELSVQVRAAEARATDARALRCPYCHADVSRDEAKWERCAACEALHHRACWWEGTRCATCRHETSFPALGRPRVRLVRRPPGTRSSFRPWHLAVLILIAGVLTFLSSLRPPMREQVGPYLPPIILDVGYKEPEPVIHNELRPREPFTRVEDLSPELRSSYDRGYQDTANRRLAGAVLNLTTVIAARPRCRDAWIELAIARADAKQSALGIDAASRAVELDPTSSPARDVLAYARLWTRDLSGAWADLDRSVAFNPDDAYAHHLRSRILEDWGSTRAALDEAERALEIEPGRAEYWAWSGYLREALGDREGAIAHVTHALALNPQDEGSRDRLIRLLAAQAAEQAAQGRSR